MFLLVHLTLRVDTLLSHIVFSQTKTLLLSFHVEKSLLQLPLQAYHLLVFLGEGVLSLQLLSLDAGKAAPPAAAAGGGQ